MQTTKYILGSRSPRRLELLQQIVPADQISVLPPKSTEEAGFEELHSWDAIEQQLLEIARAKSDDVMSQLAARDDNTSVLVTADTIIVVNDENGRPLVLGQPPDDETWRDVVRSWFRDYYAGRTHIAATGFCVRLGERRIENIVKSSVTFTEGCERWLEWYLETEEPIGKAGGYALQGAGGMFVTNVAGSISNVVGLPLGELMEAFDELGVI